MVFTQCLTTDQSSVTLYWVQATSALPSNSGAYRDVVASEAWQ